MKKGRHVLSAIMVLCIILGTVGCSTDNTVDTHTNVPAQTTVTGARGDDVGVADQKTLSNDEYLAAVPEQDRYMFLSGRCNGEFPDNSEIKRISFLIINYSMVWKSIYGSVDFETGKATYGMTDGGLYPIDEYQIVDLTDSDIEAYREAFDWTILHDELELDMGYWKIAVEYNDGTCYAYQFDKSGYTRNTAENIMISTYFDKMDLDDNTRDYFSIKGY